MPVNVLSAMSAVASPAATVRRARASRLAVNTAWMCARGGVRMALQAAYFVIVARVLGAAGYGEFMGVSVLAAMLAPFGSFGTGNLLVRNVSREPATMAESWSTALVTTGTAGVILIGLLVGLAAVILPGTAVLLLVLVGAAELVFAQLADICGKVFQAQQRLDVTAGLDTGLSAAKLLAAVGLYALVSSPTPVAWAWFYAAANGIAATIGLCVVYARHGLLPVRLSLSGRATSEGLYFALSQWIQAVQRDIDKMLIVRFSGLHAAGIYTAASRIVDITFTPVLAMLSASYPGFFRHGASGLRAAMVFGRPLLVAGGLYGAVSGLVLVSGASVLPLILGESFEASVHAVQWLALINVFRAFHYVAGDILTGAGFQRRRTCLQIVAGAAAVLIAMWAIPLYSWQGAAGAALVSNLLLVAASWIAIALTRKTQ